MTGFITVPRSVFDHSALARGKEPATRLEAFLWLVKEASWADRVVRFGKREVVEIPLKRGQLCHTHQHMADAWNWSRTQVQRFLDDLKRDTGSDTRIDTALIQNRMVLTIEKYEVFQGGSNVVDTGLVQRPIQDPGTNRIRDNQNKKEEVDYSYVDQPVNVAADAAAAEHEPEVFQGVEVVEAEIVEADQPANVVPLADKAAERAAARQAAADALEAEFEKFWKGYPAHEGRHKPTARKEWLKARKRASFEQIMKGLAVYVSECETRNTSIQYIVRAHNWLKNERWDMQPAANTIGGQAYVRNQGGRGQGSAFFVAATRYAAERDLAGCAD